MGQKANPVVNRLGITRGWDSNWYGGKDFSDKLVEDFNIRKYLNARIQKGGISKIIIERTLNRITISIHTSRPGIIIGKGGVEVDKIKEEIKKITNKEVQINIVEIRRPEVDAAIVGETICKQLEARVNFRRAVKMAIASAMRQGVEGIKVKCSGRLGGAEMARSEEYKEGRTPLHTFRADIDYAIKEANTIYGIIGVKVWICKGEVLSKRDFSQNIVGDEPKRVPRTGDKRPPREGERGERGERRDNNDRRGGGDRRPGGGGDRRGGGGGGRKK